MFALAWSWLCLPYLVCAAGLVAIGVTAAVIRGDRVLRLGVIGAAITALPWAVCSAIACATDDAHAAARLLRIGSGPVALIGPNLLLVLLGISGQLERHRWAARAAGVTGAVLMALCWGTDWTVPGVRRLSSGVYYVSAGPLTDFHISQMAMWLAVGLVIARRSMMRGERRSMMRVIAAAGVLAAIGGTDLLLVHGVVGAYPIAWLPATIACGITLYLELRTDLLRPRGLDRTVLGELLGLAAAAVVVGGLARVLQGAAPVAVAAAASVVWAIAIAVRWGVEQRRPQRLRGARLERFVASLADVDDDRAIAARLAALWREVAIAARTIWRAGGDALIDGTGARWALDADVIAWLVRHGEPLAAADLATMRLGPIRPRLEALATAHGATLFVPLVDRGQLVGLVEADHAAALREDERGLVAESARAAARALTYVELARSAAREGATAREVEVAEAMRRHASARRDDALGPWTLAAEYRSAPRTTGAAWTASLVGDRLAVLVTEGEAHGVVAALATAALTGAFAAATATGVASLDELLAILRASAERVRGGAPLAAFVAVLGDRTIQWACAGHPGARLVIASPATDVDSARATAIALPGGGSRLGAGMDLARGEAALARTATLVVTSGAVPALAPTPDPPARLVAALVAAAPSRDADLLAVAIRRLP